MKTSEEVERQNIDLTLAAAGWTIQDQNVVNLPAASVIAVRVFPLKGGFGSADYRLYVNGQAVGVVKVKA